MKDQRLLLQNASDPKSNYSLGAVRIVSRSYRAGCLWWSKKKQGWTAASWPTKFQTTFPRQLPACRVQVWLATARRSKMEETRPSHASFVVDQIGKIDATLSELDRKSPAMVVCGWHTSVATDERFGQRQLWTSIGGSRAEGASSRRPRGRHGCDGSMAAKLAWQRASEKGLFGG
jgi:hypothetical protein